MKKIIEISDKKDSVWTWVYDNSVALVYENGEKIRFKVQKAFLDQKGDHLII